MRIHLFLFFLSVHASPQANLVKYQQIAAQAQSAASVVERAKMAAELAQSAQQAIQRAVGAGKLTPEMRSARTQLNRDLADLRADAAYVESTANYAQNRYDARVRQQSNIDRVNLRKYEKQVVNKAAKKQAAEQRRLDSIRRADEAFLDSQVTALENQTKALIKKAQRINNELAADVARASLSEGLRQPPLPRSSVSRSQPRFTSTFQRDPAVQEHEKLRVIYQ